MNLFLWILQILLALHTLMGAAWKLSNPAQGIPSLAVIPPSLWLAMGGLEVVCALGLVLPKFYRAWHLAAPLAALGIALEMLVFSGLHLGSGEADPSQPIYWLVVAGLSGFIAYGRLALRPLRY